MNAAGRPAPSNEAFLDLAPRQSCSTSPPLNLAAIVANRVVTLTWDLPADGSDEPPRIVAGSAPAWWTRRRSSRLPTARRSTSPGCRPPTTCA